MLGTFVSRTVRLTMAFNTAGSFVGFGAQREYWLRSPSFRRWLAGRCLLRDSTDSIGQQQRKNAKSRDHHQKD
jgi:hypothetical protein